MRKLSLLGLGGMAASLLFSTSVLAHGVAGDRFFPATLGIDDPAVADELSLPTIAILKNADNARQVDLSFEYSKRITELFGISVGDTYTRLRPRGQGWGNFETTFKYQAITNAPHEFILSAGVEVEWGNTGARAIGENFTTVTPTIWFGKGFGDLPTSLNWARPFAVTGQVGYAIPASAKKVTFTGLDEDTGQPSFDVEHHPRFVSWGGTLQYSLPYLKASVVDLGLPDFVNHLIPIVEASMLTPVSNNFDRQRTTGTINPGVIWAGQKVQVGLEALIPINRDSGRHIGFLGQIHFYLDDIFPNSIGRPIFQASAR
jgi:hypothetical protein